MKTTRTFLPIQTALTALAVAALVTVPVAASAQEKGSERLMKLNRIETTADATAVEAGDTIVMSCPKCKDTWVTVVETTFKPANAQSERLVQQHQCPGCSTKRVTTGHGKAKTTTYVHVCKACGSEDVTCCVMKKGTGPTTGMQ